VGLITIKMESLKLNFLVERQEISYLRWIIESYDGIAFLKTIDPHQAVIELDISPGCNEFINELLDFLRRHENIKLDQIGAIVN
jgi:hypothetical protein